MRGRRRRLREDELYFFLDITIQQYNNKYYGYNNTAIQ